MTPRYIDAHCHVQFEQYDTDRDELIARMREQEVAGIVVGCDIESSRKAAELAQRHEHLYVSVGLHPNKESDEWYEVADYRSLAKNPKVVAIGECGLDYFRPTEVNDEVKRKQKRILSDQIALAIEIDKPLIIHCRPSFAKATEGKPSNDAYLDLIEILTETKQKNPSLRGDIHFFVGGLAEAEAFISLGFTLSFTAVITFARDYDEVIKTIPLTSILSETDAPYVAPASRRGQRNDPLAVIDVVAKIAEIRGEDLETVRVALLANAQQLFGLTS